MQINKLNIYPVSLPFSITFPHSLRKRSFVNNIVVEVVSTHGEIRGYGEGAPRTYVTGESQQSAIGSICNFIRHDNFPWDLQDVSRVWDFIDSLPKEKEFNSATCALEMALLDALGKSESRSIIEYFPKTFYNGGIHYGAALPLAARNRVEDFCRLIKKLNINKLKLKLGKDFEQNKIILDTVALTFGNGCDLKVDINCVWDRELAVQHIPLLKKYKVKVVEQPMMPGNSEISVLSKIMQTCGIVLMADESACSLTDIKNITKSRHYQMINVRLSKCGGLRRSMEIIDYLRKTGVSFQIGCQLGESGLLSAAGRILCLLCRDALYFDGSYDAFLLKENITVENVSFGPAGAAGPLTGPGLGVDVSRESLTRLSGTSGTRTIVRTF